MHHQRPAERPDDGVTARASERLGVFGGTFDPPHFGHVAAALEVRHLLRLDRILLVVANDPWQKTELAPVTPAPDRLALTVAAATGIDGLDVSDIEIRRGGPSSTADTLEALRDRLAEHRAGCGSADGAMDGCRGHGAGHSTDDRPDDGGPGAGADLGVDRSEHDPDGAGADSGGLDPELFMIVGSDAAAGLATWKRADDIRQLATTVVVNRTGRHAGGPPSDWDHLVVNVPALEISSADLRARFADGRPVEALVPQAVIEGVRERGLYGSGR